MATADERMTTVELYADELSALITVARNRYGWTDTEFHNEAPPALQAAVAALYEAWGDLIDQDDEQGD